MKKIISLSFIMLTCTIYAFVFAFKRNYNIPDNYNVKNKPSISCITPAMSLLSVTSVANGGDWNNPATWSTNSVPTSADDVTISMGSTVTLSGTIAANSIVVMGTLKPPTSTTDFSITTKGIVVMGMGSLLEIGTATNLYTGKCTITLTGSDPTAILFPSMASMGTKLIGAMSGGTLDLHGSNKKSWTNLNGDALVGATQITLDNIDGWMVGDEIVIVSSRSDWNEAEKRTITAINAATKTVSFATALLKPHYGTAFTYTSGGKTWNANLRAEVGLLTHNIKIQGDAASETAGFGGHIMVMRDDRSTTWGSAYVENIELFRMGQKKMNGRYPFHWHMLGNAGDGQYFKNNSEHISYNRALTIHGTSKTTVENNFFYDHIGHGIFLENGSEINNTIKGNVVLLTKRPAQGEELTPSDNQLNEAQNRTPSSYWITNPNNNFTDNVAAGTQGTGFWYALAQDFMFQSLNNSLFDGQQKPYKEAFGGFTGNKAHSCMNGFDIFDQLDANHLILTNRGWTENSLKHFTNNTFYANDLAIYSGIGDGRLSSSKIIFQDNIFVENKVATMLASYSIIDQSVFVASSGKNLISGVPKLYRFYDGAGTVKNSYFVGWNATNSNFLENIGGAIHHVNTSFENISFDHLGTIRMESLDYSRRMTGYSGANSDNHPRRWAVIIKDKTGSLSGNPDSSIVSNHPFILPGGETQPSNWTNMYSTNRSYALSLINYDLPIGQDPPRIPNVSVTRTKEGTPTASVYYIYGYNEWHQLPVIVNEGFLYTYQYESLPLNTNNISTKYIQQRVLDADSLDSYVSRYKDFGKLGGLSVTQQQPTGSTLTVYTSRLDLENGATSGYYVEHLGDLYIKSVATTNDQYYAIRWTTDFAVPALDTDGDGYVDSSEGPLDRLPTDASDLRFTFTSTSDNWGTSGNTIDATTAVASSNSWKIVSKGNDADIFRDNLNFDGNKVNSIKADLKSNLSGSFKLYWTTQNDPSYSEDKAVVFNYSTANLRKTINFNLRNNPKWINNTIKSLKLKMLDGSNAAPSSTNVYSIFASASTTECLNNPLTFTYQTPAGATGIGTPTGLPSGVSAEWANNMITISGTPIGSGNFDYSIPVNGGSPSFVTGIIIVTANGQWLGETSADWNTETNWCGSVPTAATNVIIPSGTPFSPTIAADTAAVCNDLTINASATLILANSATSLLNISGSMTNNGTLNAGVLGTVIFNGATAKTITGTSTTTFSNLTINTAANEVTVTNTAKAFAVSGDLSVTKGNLVVQATDNNYNVTGNLIVGVNGTLTHNVNNGTGKNLQVSGNVAIDGIYSKGAATSSNLRMIGIGKTVHTGSSSLSILIISGSVTADGPLTVNQNFWPTFGASAVFNTAGHTVIAKAGLLTSGGIINVNGGNLSVVTGGFTLGTGAISSTVLNISAGSLITDSFYLGSTNTSGATTINHTGGTFTVSGAATIHQPTADSVTNTWNINNQTATVNGLITFAGSNATASRVGKIAITTGTLNANGGITFVGSNAATKVIDMSGGAGTLYLKGALTVPAASSTLLSGTSSTFIYNSTSAQTVNFFSAGGYGNLSLSGSGTKTFAGGTTIAGTLAMSGTAVALLPNSSSSTANTFTSAGVYQVAGSWGGSTSSAANNSLNLFGSTTTGILNTTCNPPVGITANSNSPLCSGATLNLGASLTTVGSPTPTYSWTGPNSFTSTSQNPSITNVTNPVAGTYTVTATNSCGSVSGSTTVTVNPVLTASVNIATTATTICSGTSVTFTATSTHGGTTPSYQWKLNGSTVGTDSATYTTTTLANNDVVTVVMTSNASPCLTGSPATSNTVTMIVNTPTTWYADTDSDLFGDASMSQLACEKPLGYVVNSADCNPADGTIWQLTTFYVDADADGYTNGNASVCSGLGAPTGYSSDSSGIDCDDNAYSLNNDCGSAGYLVNLTMFVQGYYTGSRMMTSVKLNQDSVSPADEVEEVTVKLHDATTYALVDSAIGTLKTDGALSVTFRAAAAGSYYVAVKGVNLVQTWTANPIAVGATPASYDFSAAATQAYGSNMIEVFSGVWAFYSGDINQDDTVDNSDSDTLFSDIENSNFGILATDMNGDGSVDNSDTDAFYINVENSIYSNHP